MGGGCGWRMLVVGGGVVGGVVVGGVVVGGLKYSFVRVEIA